VGFRRLTYSRSALTAGVDYSRVNDPLSAQNKKPEGAQSGSLPSAIKHGGFSATTILPGESASEFEQQHREVIAELNLEGALENEIGLSLAHLLWRKKNLPIFSKAERARQRVNEIRDALLRSLNGALSKSDETDDFEEGFKKKWRAAESQAREELGESYDLVEMGEDATLEGLAKQLAIQERLDMAIDRCVRRLLFVRGLKSLSIEPNPNSRQRLSGPRAG
jgi:hypothetical protein